jgi:hypothetical protein
MTSKNIFLSEEGLRTLIKNSGPKSLLENTSGFGENILWTIKKNVELPIILDDKGFASIKPFTLIGKDLYRFGIILRIFQNKL